MKVDPERADVCDVKGKGLVPDGGESGLEDASLVCDGVDVAESDDDKGVRGTVRVHGGEGATCVYADGEAFPGEVCGGGDGPVCDVVGVPLWPGHKVADPLCDEVVEPGGEARDAHDVEALEGLDGDVDVGLSQKGDVCDADVVFRVDRDDEPHLALHAQVLDGNGDLEEPHLCDGNGRPRRAVLEIDVHLKGVKLGHRVVAVGSAPVDPDGAKHRGVGTQLKLGEGKRRAPRRPVVVQPRIKRLPHVLVKVDMARVPHLAQNDVQPLGRLQHRVLKPVL